MPAAEDATEASVAGSSVALTEADEDAAYSRVADGDPSDGKRVIVTKAKGARLDLSLHDGGKGGDGDEKEPRREGEGDEGEEYVAPMHLHALRTPAKLRGAGAGARSRSSSRGSRPGSQRSSASPPRKAGSDEAGGSVSPASSLDGVSHASSEIHDPDILLDKLGFRDLDLDATQEELQEMLKKHISSHGSLPTLNERMSEETLDDVHAFQDLHATKGGDASKKGGLNLRETLAKAREGVSSSAILGSTGFLLNTLNEAEEEEGGSDEGGEEVVLEIPDGFEIVQGGGGGKKGMKKLRSTMCSTAAVASESSIDDDEEDDDDAEVVIPTDVMWQLEVSESKRNLEKKLDRQTTSLSVAGSEVDYLEDDEQDGLEADRAEEPR
ncbi:hypothetical protein ACHAWF_001208 [Thalassiosira exigua]